MLLIFGVRRRGQRLATIFAMCGICHSPAAQAVVRIKTFFTFFFIPLIPLGSKYRSTCTLCGGSVSLTREQADHAVATMQEQRAAAPAPGPGQPAPVAAAQPYDHAQDLPAPPSVTDVVSDEPGDASGGAPTT